MMRKKILCGRLIRSSDGGVKKLHLSKGGGTRDCNWDNIDMSFDEIHESMRKIFQINLNERQSRIYDFRQQPLDTNRYRTFFEYVTINGLKFKGTLLYLCTPEDYETFVPPVRPPAVVIPRPVITSTTPVAPRRVEADSSTSPATIKIDETSPDERSTRYEFRDHLRRSAAESFHHYSFDRALKELVQYCRHVITGRPQHLILVQLYGDLCTLRGLVSFVLDRLKEQIRTSLIDPQSVYRDALEQIATLSRNIKVSMELNKMKIRQIDSSSILIDAFLQYHRHFTYLHEQWTKPTPSRRSPERETRHRRRHSRSRSRSRSKSKDLERRNLFKPLIDAFHHFKNEINSRYEQTLYDLMKSNINEVIQCRNHFVFTDSRSFVDAEQMIKSVESRLKKKLDDERRRSYRYPSSRYQHALDGVFTAIHELSTALDQYNPQTHLKKRVRYSTPPPPLALVEHVEKKPNINEPIQLDDDDDDDDDRSSEVSHSSVDDDVLFDTAKESVIDK